MSFKMKKNLLLSMGLVLISSAVSANIIHDYISGKIVRATCPEDKPLMDDQGFCHSCFELGEVKILENIDIIDMCHTEAGLPIREGKRGHFETQSTYLISCPEIAPLKIEGKGCFACDYSGSPKIEENECLKCNKNGKNIRIYEDGFCKLADCTNKNLKSMDGGCYSCDFEDNVEVLPGMCEKMCPNRESQGMASYGNFSIEYCGLKEKINVNIPNNCPPEKPILDNMGECRACDFYRENIYAFSGCEKCPNREESGVWYSDVGRGVQCRLKTESDKEF